MLLSKVIALCSTTISLRKESMEQYRKNPLALIQMKREETNESSNGSTDESDAEIIPVGSFICMTCNHFDFYASS